MQGGMNRAGSTNLAIMKRAAQTLGRFHRGGLVVAAAALTVLSVGSVLALVTDSITFQSATAASNGWEPEPEMDLRVKFGGCDVAGEDIYDTAIFSDDTVMTFSPASQEFDFAAINAAGGGEGLVDIPPSLCLANAGSDYGSLDVAVIGLVSSELDDCGATEAAAETNIAHSGCLTGEAGELEYVTELVLREYCAGGDQTSYGAGDWDMWSIGNVAEIYANSYSHSVGHLQAGEYCTVDLELWANFPTADDSLTAAMSDYLELTIAIDLTDATT